MGLYRLFLLAVVLVLGLAGPVSAAPTTPTADFTDNGDGTVTHKTTGLTWKRCAEGQTWTGSNCSGTAKTYTWAQANTLSTSGWRLPTIAELVTIVEWANYSPAINTTIFPNTGASYFWSASGYTSPGSSGLAWVVNFYDGQYSNSVPPYTFYARLVRGGLPIDSSGLYTPTTDFTDNGDGTVAHKRTGLAWKHCAEGQTWTGSTCSGTAQTYAWSAANALSTGGWRLPTQNELVTVVEWSKYHPAINTTIFPDTPSYYFWSASAYTYDSARAWGIHFSNGDGHGLHTKTDSYHVRLVRGGQSTQPPVADAPPTISNTNVSFSASTLCFQSPCGSSGLSISFRVNDADTASLSASVELYTSSGSPVSGSKVDKGSFASGALVSHNYSLTELAALLGTTPGSYTVKMTVYDQNGTRAVSNTASFAYAPASAVTDAPPTISNAIVSFSTSTYTKKGHNLPY